MTSSKQSGTTLRLIWPQWQGAQPEVVAMLTPELPFDAAQLGYHLGSRLLQTMAPRADGPEAVVPVDTSRDALHTKDGIFARDSVLTQLRAALETIATYTPDRIVTLGGECSVSVAPFTYLASRYGSDLAVVWMDAHPDTGMPECNYDGYHAMAVSHILGHGDPEVVATLPAVVETSHVVLAGLHAWEPDQEPFTRGWGLATFGPEALNTSPQPLLDWLRATGCSKVAIHLDVDCIDSNDIILGMGMEPNGLTREAVVNTLQQVAHVGEVVALTVAEYVPRQAIAMQNLLAKLPLLGTLPDGRSHGLLRVGAPKAAPGCSYQVEGRPGRIASGQASWSWRNPGRAQTRPVPARALRQHGCRPGAASRMSSPSPR
jgi:arginase